MRIPVEGHLTQPWRIHEIAPDFRVEDVWAYRTPGAGPDDFPAMLAALMASNEPGRVRQGDALAVRGAVEAGGAVRVGVPGAVPRHESAFVARAPAG